jgi:hypothetical protein
MQENGMYKSASALEGCCSPGLFGVCKDVDGKILTFRIRDEEV